MVFELAENYLDKGYRIYFDNFYSTVKLFHNLEIRRTYASGTIRSDRRMFPRKIRIRRIQISTLSLCIGVTREMSMLVLPFKGLVLRFLKENMVILSLNQKLNK